jgi:hypothetical protein
LQTAQKKNKARKIIRKALRTSSLVFFDATKIQSTNYTGMPISTNQTTKTKRIQIPIGNTDTLRPTDADV